MAGRIVVFGATGYTGRLTAEALVAHGQRPVLAGRDAGRLDRLAAELGDGLETTVADVARPETVMALVGEGDVLVSTVGPFVKFGDPAAEAAIAARAHYLDSTGEPPFIRRVFEHYGPQAKRAGIGMLTAFGYDWVPGNLAAALALRDAGRDAVRVDTGYFVTGAAGASSFSGGTKASLAAVASEPAFAFRDGALRTVRTADRRRSFALRGREMSAVTVGSSEHFGLPATHPGLREVNSYLGWFGPLSRPVQAFSLIGAGAMKVPGARALSTKLADRFVRGSTGGPGPEQRARSGSYIVAEAYDVAGAKLAEVHLTGVDPYSFTAGILAWGARRAATDGMRASGALGPDGAFGLDELEAGCREAGLTRS
ncbi:MAG TPA: saccharopine dehydrogenase NADP-binding domain-containing protein [Thermoleophilaceae bacterium]|nr:saccharopine dehydrogenase NADP-binding domain-containing protein [Thermoleophilaceae bacterium]